MNLFLCMKEIPFGQSRKIIWKMPDEEQLTSYVEEIKEINNISQEGMIYAGRYLILPIYEKIEAI